MASVLRDGNFMQLLGIALGMTVIVSVLSYGAWHFAGLQRFKNNGLCLFNRLAFIGVGDFPGRNDEMEFYSPNANGYRFQKERLYYVILVEKRKTMRLDKFLKVSRLIKRRTVAKEVADKGRVFINEKWRNLQQT